MDYDESLWTYMRKDSHENKDKNFSDSKPLIIAEMSNHNQSLERALKLIRAAAESGADAIKLQTYTPDTMTFNSTSKILYKDKESLWDGRSLFIYIKPILLGM